MATPRRNRNVQVFESSISKLARILSRKWGVKVIFQHGRCETQGKVIYLPVLPDNATQDLMDAMQGHLDHEVAHVVLTDFDVLAKLKRKEKKLFTTLNALEDPRIERKFAELWPGSRFNFAKSLEWSLTRVAEKAPDPRTGKVSRNWDELSDLGKVLYAATIYGCTAFDSKHWFLTDVVEPEVMTRLKAVETIIQKARAASTTEEVVECAREFLKAINEVEEKQDYIDPEDIGPEDKFIPPQSPQDHVMRKKPPKPEPGEPKVIELEPNDPDDEEQQEHDGLQAGGPQQPGGSDGGDEEESEADSPGATAGAGPADDDGEEGDETEEGSKSKSKSKKQSGQADEDGEASSGEGEIDPNAEPAEGEPEDDAEGEEVAGQVGKQHGGNAQHKQKKRPPKPLPQVDATDKELDKDAELIDVNRMLKEAAEFEIKGHDTYLVYTTEGDRIELIKEGDKQLYRTFMTQAISMVAVMKRKLTRAMLSTAQSSWEPDKLRGKINPRAAHRVALGTSKRVFRQRVEAETFDTAVQMMIDHSGSMSGDKLHLAAMTAIILGEVCHQLGISFSVCGFSTGQGYAGAARQSKASPEERQIYSRWDDQWIGMYKDFDDNWQSNSHKIITMPQHCKSNTYDGESLRLGAQRLLQRREKRKILFWLNDGQPCPTHCDDGDALIEYTAQCAKEVEKLVEVVAIGIKTNAVKQFYTNWVQVNSLDDLPKVCLQKLTELLIKGKNAAQKKARK